MLLALVVGTTFDFARYFGRTQIPAYVYLALVLRTCAIVLLFSEVVKACRSAIPRKVFTKVVLVALLCVWIPEAIKGIFW
jgi:hypothetical protein